MIFPLNVAMEENIHYWETKENERDQGEKITLKNQDNPVFF